MGDDWSLARTYNGIGGYKKKNVATIALSAVSVAYPRDGAFSSDAYLERLEVDGVAFEAVEHLPHRPALDSILGLDQDHTVSPYGERRDGKTVA